MSNPEPGIYLGNLNEDLDLLFFNENSTFGIFYTWKPVTSRSEPWPHKMPLESSIPCTNPRTWSKYSKETYKIIEIAANHGDEIGFESHIRPAIIEILDSIREVKELILAEKELEPILFKVKKWKSCPECECYLCYQKGLCGTGCENPNKICTNNILEVLN
jgi:hypothetical protein